MPSGSSQWTAAYSGVKGTSLRQGVPSRSCWRGRSPRQGPSPISRCVSFSQPVLAPTLAWGRNLTVAILKLIFWLSAQLNYRPQQKESLFFPFPAFRKAQLRLKCIFSYKPSLRAEEMADTPQ